MTGDQMRILHGNAYASPRVIDGVNSSVWTIVREQAAMGHEVGIVLGEPTQEARGLAASWGVIPQVVGPNLSGYGRDIRCILRRWRPDVLHLHSTFTPRLAIASHLADRAGIPIVLSPHGGLRPFFLGRGSWKQSLYARGIERRRFQRAAAITVVLPSESELVARFAPGFDGLVPIVPPPVPDERIVRTSGSAAGPVVFLGRFDVTTKGLDRWVEIARCLPDLEFALYGEGPDRPWLEEHCPPNVQLNDPVFGTDKRSVLASARLYLQTSRWDAFPVSLCEAMLAGVPTAVSATMDLAPAFLDGDLGIVLPDEPVEAAKAIAAALADGDRSQARALRAQRYAQPFRAPAVAAALLAVYEDVIAERIAA